MKMNNKFRRQNSSLSTHSCPSMRSRSERCNEFTRQKKSCSLRRLSIRTMQAMKRQMTPRQELWNALSMLPFPLYCLYYSLNGNWLSELDISSTVSPLETTLVIVDKEQGQITPDQCLQSSLLPNLYAIPPLTVIMITIACTLHSPCSMCYHILCAYKLPPGHKRMDHWSRRLDQAMIHFVSFMFAYATSGNRDYFFFSMLFNIDCMYRLFQKEIRPKRTLYRMAAAFLLPVLPLLVRGEAGAVFQLLVIYGISAWLFAKYPFGGWSHCMFHFVCFLSNPILMKASLNLELSQEHIALAARCAFLAKTGNFV